jgi:hypothetical protein
MQHVFLQSKKMVTADSNDIYQTYVPRAILTVLAMETPAEVIA